jgi:hypothetical protein
MTITDHHRDDRDDLNDLDDLDKNSVAVNPPAERMGTGMGNRAFDSRHSPRAIRDAPADFPPTRKHPHKSAKPLDCGEPSPLSLSEWLTSLCSYAPLTPYDNRRYNSSDSFFPWRMSIALSAVDRQWV